MVLAAFDPSNPLAWLQAGGVPAAVLGLGVAFVKRWIVPGHIYEDAIVDRNRERERREQIEEIFREKVLPAVISSTDTTRQVIDLLREEQVERRIEEHDRLRRGSEHRP